jgi:hypothetical protein
MSFVSLKIILNFGIYLFEGICGNIHRETKIMEVRLYVGNLYGTPPARMI